MSYGKTHPLFPVAGIILIAIALGHFSANGTETLSAAIAPPTYYRMKINASFPPPSFPQDNRLTNEGVELGRRLFFDTGLSKDGTVSCASCHHPEGAFSDPDHKTSSGIGGQQTRRNAMPLFNLPWRRNFFWDGRAATLREQVMHPLTDPKEMAADADALARRLGKDPAYAPAFSAAFGSAPVTSASIALALEQFLLTQISQNSKFDHARLGETTFTLEEEHGLELFFTEFNPGRNIRGGDCFHCHGNVLFTSERFANNGLDADGPDKGRYEITKQEYDKMSFKVPTLRNLSYTAPYMHDGRFKTLEEVVEHYDSGVEKSSSLDPNIAKHEGPMQLSEPDKKALVAFLRTLDDPTFVEQAKSLGKSPPETTASVISSPSPK